MQIQTQKVIANYFLCKEILKHEGLLPIRCNKIYLRARNQGNKRTWKPFGFICPQCHTIYDNIGGLIQQTKDSIKLQLGKPEEKRNREGEKEIQFITIFLKADCKHKWNSKLIQDKDTILISWKCAKCNGFITQEIGKIISPQDLSNQQLETLNREESLLI